MSYILDALKKAEAERNAGTRASIHAPLPYASPTDVSRSRWATPGTWLAAGAAIALCGAAAWYFVPREQPVRLATATPQAAAPAAPVLTPPPATREASPAPEPSKPAVKKFAEKKRASEPAKPKAEKKPEPRPEPPPETALPALRELPDNLRQQIPPLTIGGYIYSGSKSDRSVLINNRLMHEGEEVAPGLTLERMTPNSMVLNFRGTRYRSSY
jgi:general secretion pathway protein B